jgi:uncharacterized protein (DUF488 family)
MSAMKKIATIGYEAATMRSFLEALTDAKVQLLVDVRAVASSRRPGFAKTKLAANLRDLGTPADGRAAARAGRHDEMKAIFREQLATPQAQAQLDTVQELVTSGRRIALLCFEANPEHCHRNLVAHALAERIPLRIEHLAPGEE